MSETNGFATKEAFAPYAGKRRFKPHMVPTIGKVILGSIDAAGFTRLDAASNRALLSARSDDSEADQIVALRDKMILAISMIVLDQEHNPIFNAESDRAFLLSLDASILNPLYEACLEHCNISDVSVRELEKNSQGTSGENSPSSSGTT